MPIEFRCTSCGKLLRVPDEAGGKHAKCPACGMVLAVPATGAAMPIDVPPVPGVGPQPPVAYPPGAASGYSGGASPGAIVPTLVTVEQMLGRTWAIFKAQWVNCILAYLAVFACTMIVNFAFAFACSAVGAMSHNRETMLLMDVVSNIGTTCFNIWIQIGQVLVFLQIARNQPIQFGDIFNGGRFFLPILGASILVGLAVMVGLVCLIVPGIIVALMFSQFYCLIVDRQLRVMESLEVSRQVMVGNKLTLFLAGLIAVLLAIPVIILTCGLGILVVGGFGSLMGPVVYLSVTGQPTAAGQ